MSKSNTNKFKTSIRKLPILVLIDLRNDYNKALPMEILEALIVTNLDCILIFYGLQSQFFVEILQGKTGPDQHVILLSNKEEMSELLAKRIIQYPNTFHFAVTRKPLVKVKNNNLIYVSSDSHPNIIVTKILRKLKPESTKSEITTTDLLASTPPD